MLAIMGLLAVAWIYLGHVWYEEMSRRARQMGRSFGMQVSLAQTIVLVLGLGAQLGVVVNYLESKQPGWELFLLIPPLATWGLLEGVKPLTGISKEEARERARERIRAGVQARRGPAPAGIDGNAPSATMERADST
ncbi:MAG: hypothetical protein M5U26_14705 [Planctomycetota bacterium]|nr:hypothetical protein [Planctomycetota bacterium]